jgi:hypothetical protein
MSKSFSSNLVEIAISPIVYPPVFIISLLGSLFGDNKSASPAPGQLPAARNGLSSEIEALQSRKAMIEQAFASLADKERSLRNAIARCELELQEKETAIRRRDEQERLAHREEAELSLAFETQKKELERNLKLAKEEAAQRRLMGEDRLRQEIAELRRQAEIELASEREMETAKIRREIEVRRSEEFSHLEEEVRQSRKTAVAKNASLDDGLAEVDRILAETRENGMKAIEDELARRKADSDREAVNLREARVAELEAELGERRTAIEQELARLRADFDQQIKSLRERDLSELDKEQGMRKADLEKEMQVARQNAFVELERAIAERRATADEEILAKLTRREADIYQEAVNLQEAKLSEMESELGERRAAIEKDLAELKADFDQEIKSLRERDLSELDKERGMRKADLEKEAQVARQNAFAELERAIAERRATTDEEIRTKQKAALEYIESWTERETARLRDRLKEEFDIQLEEMRNQLQEQSGKRK